MARPRRRVDDYRDAVTRSDLPPSAKLVAVAMSNYMHYSTLANAYPGPARLKKELGMSVRTIERRLALLVERGWLEKTAIGGSFPRRRATVYRGRIPNSTSDNPDTSQGQSTSDTGDTRTSDSVDGPTAPKGADKNRGGALRPTLDGSAPAPRTGYKLNWQKEAYE